MHESIWGLCLKTKLQDALYLQRKEAIMGLREQKSYT